MVHVSFSWDDGAIEDLKLMELSLRFNVPAIFFIPARNDERKVIRGEHIKTLFSNGFEIGSHTFSHSYLTQVSYSEAEQEMNDGKDYLEQILGTELPHFAFPGGKYNKDLVKLSKKYFRSARTADTGRTLSGSDYLVKPSFHFFDRGKKSLIFNSLKGSSRIFQLALHNIFAADYFNILNDILRTLARREDHTKVIIWGHSWEIETHQLWDLLKNLFDIRLSEGGITFTRYSDILTFNNK